MKKSERIVLMRAQLAASAGRTRRTEIAAAPGVVPHVHTDKTRITLAGLRFMGQQPHPSQTHEETSYDPYDDDTQDV